MIFYPGNVFQSCKAILWQKTDWSIAVMALYNLLVEEQHQLSNITSCDDPVTTEPAFTSTIAFSPNLLARCQTTTCTILPKVFTHPSQLLKSGVPICRDPKHGSPPFSLYVCVLSFPVCIIPPVSLPLSVLCVCVCMWAWSPSTGSARWIHFSNQPYYKASGFPPTRRQIVSSVYVIAALASSLPACLLPAVLCFPSVWVHSRDGPHCAVPQRRHYHVADAISRHSPSHSHWWLHDPRLDPGTTRHPSPSHLIAYWTLKTCYLLLTCCF